MEGTRPFPPTSMLKLIAPKHRADVGVYFARRARSTMEFAERIWAFISQSYLHSKGIRFNFDFGGKGWGEEAHYRRWAFISQRPVTGSRRHWGANRASNSLSPAYCRHQANAWNYYAPSKFIHRDEAPSAPPCNTLNEILWARKRLLGAANLPRSSTPESAVARQER